MVNYLSCITLFLLCSGVTLLYCNLHRQ